MEKEKSDPKEEEHDSDQEAMDAIEAASVQMDIESSDRRWLKDLTKTFAAIVATNDENGKKEFVLSQRVSFSRDMAMVAIFDRITRIAKSDIEPPLRQEE